jgi:HAD superfamily hydrolase (TIGR01509 family)
MIKAVIFDLNGIFLQSEKLSDRFEKDFKIDSKIFKTKLMEIMEEVRRPNAQPAFTYWKPILEEWNIKLSEQEFWDYWFNGEIESTKMIQYATYLRDRGVKVFILSNNFKERAEYYGHYPWIHEAVDKVYFSWKTGFVKPDVKAWQLILSENNLEPEDCIYFDDQEKNLLASKEVRIKPYLFTNEIELENIINKHLKED